MVRLKNLLELLSDHGGKIISTATMDVQEINQAKASGRIFIDEQGLGFVWEPVIDFPTTDEAVEQFEKWYPLDFEPPEGILDRVLGKIITKFECDLPGYDLIGCPLIKTDCKTCKHNVK